MACSSPCDGFRNNIVQGVSAAALFEQWCKGCDYWTGEDHSKFTIACEHCLDRGYYFGYTESAAEAYPYQPSIEQFTCDCQLTTNKGA